MDFVLKCVAIGGTLKSRVRSGSGSYTQGFVVECLLCFHKASPSVRATFFNLLGPFGAEDILRVVFGYILDPTLVQMVLNLNLVPWSVSILVYLEYDIPCTVPEPGTAVVFNNNLGPEDIDSVLEYTLHVLVHRTRVGRDTDDPGPHGPSHARY
jgi:hypothetical protein